MATLTAKELGFLEDQLTMEQLLVKKFKNIAAQTDDPQIKSKCEQIAAKHSEHYSRMMSYLN